jgi:Protein of unknown function (DUF3750)
MGLALRILKHVVLWLVILPIAGGAASTYYKGWPDSWRSAKWDSSGLLPDAAATRPAEVLVLAARTGRWKSIFAEHMSLVLKPEGATHWTRYDVVGWGNPVRRDAYAADAQWYGNRPYVAVRISGVSAQALIPKIEAAIARYPYQTRGSYTVWPGPNSNSFVAWVVRNTDGFAAELPPVAVGKDYLGPGLVLAAAPSRTGFTIQAWGLAGITAAVAEGLELNILGTAIGIDPGDLAVKFAAVGKVSVFDLWAPVNGLAGGLQ